MEAPMVDKGETYDDGNGSDPEEDGAHDRAAPRAAARRIRGSRGRGRGCVPQTGTGAGVAAGTARMAAARGRQIAPPRAGVPFDEGGDALRRFRHRPGRSARPADASEPRRREGRSVAVFVPRGGEPQPPDRERPHTGHPSRVTKPDFQKGKNKMPKLTAHAKIFRDWEGLLGAVNANASLLPGVEDLQAGLEKLLAEGTAAKNEPADSEAKQLADANAAKTQQAYLTANKQSVTQNVNQILEDGAEMARKLRGFVFSHLGSRTHLVKQFSLPLRE